MLHSKKFYVGKTFVYNCQLSSLIFYFFTAVSADVPANINEQKVHAGASFYGLMKMCFFFLLCHCIIYCSYPVATLLSMSPLIWPERCQTMVQLQFKLRLMDMLLVALQILSCSGGKNGYKLHITYAGS